jgi:hypothetical protein
VGILSHHGRCTVAADGSRTTQIEARSVPNPDQTRQGRLVALIGDDPRPVNPAPPAGGGAAHISWKRAK